jgi:uncharacterized DUF497 family protein
MQFEWDQHKAAVTLRKRRATSREASAHEKHFK